MIIYIGVDNGVTGSIGIINSDGDSIQIKTPTKKEQDYIKSKSRIITRIDFPKLFNFLKQFATGYNIDKIIARIERPMVNPERFITSMNAMRSMEATMVAFEALKIPFAFIDSKEWQKAIFPKGYTNTKVASRTIGSQLFPKANIHQHDDYDGILIAEYLRRKDNA